MKVAKTSKPSRYAVIIARVFENHYTRGATELRFERTEFERCAEELGIDLPKNVGDVVYSFRYRRELPESITRTAPKGKQWAIMGAGIGSYRFKLKRMVNIVPREDLIRIKIPDATPEIISAYALNDEQALLAKVRYNRLVDIFLSITSCSLQNHLRTTVKDIGQIEVDEIYVGVNKNGQQFVIPVQAKGGKDKHGVIQTEQDIACCAQKFRDLVCRPVSAQFMPDNVIAMFELAMQDDEIVVVQEKHYQLAPSSQITPDDLAKYSRID